MEIQEVQLITTMIIKIEIPLLKGIPSSANGIQLFIVFYDVGFFTFSSQNFR